MQRHITHARSLALRSLSCTVRRDPLECNAVHAALHAMLCTLYCMQCCARCCHHLKDLEELIDLLQVRVGVGGGWVGGAFEHGTFGTGTQKNEKAYALVGKTSRG
jgi:hypothetical protein